MAFLVYRRCLPHWRLDGAAYFVTWRLDRFQADLTEDERGQVVDALRFFDHDRYALLGYVVMNDHIHVVVTPLSAWRLQDLVRSWKSFTANRLQRRRGQTGSFWQAEYHDRVIRNEWELTQKLRYIRENPAKRWPALVDYPWMWVTGMKVEGR